MAASCVERVPEVRVSRWPEEDKSASLRARRGGIGERVRGRCARRTERRIPSPKPRDDVPCEWIGIDRVLSRVGAAVDENLEHAILRFFEAGYWARGAFGHVERVFRFETRRSK